MTNKSDTKIIADILNPTPKIKGYTIRYRKAGQYIYFSAWYQDKETNGKEYRVHRSQVLHDKTFYKREEYIQNLGWLTKED